MDACSQMIGKNTSKSGAILWKKGAFSTKPENDTQYPTFEKSLTPIKTEQLRQQEWDV